MTGVAAINIPEFQNDELFLTRQSATRARAAQEARNKSLQKQSEIARWIHLIIIDQSNIRKTRAFVYGASSIVLETWVPLLSPPPSVL